MRLGPLLFAFPILAGCDDRSYRLGGEDGSRRGPAAASGGQGAGGGLDHGGTNGVAGSGGIAGTTDMGGIGGAAGSPSTAGTGSIVGTAGDGGSGTISGSGGLGGNAQQPLTREVVRVSDKFPVALVLADEAHVFFATFSALWRIDHSGVGLKQLAEGPVGLLAADATHVYWPTLVDIRRVAKTGGVTEILTAFDTSAKQLDTWLALDDAYVYASSHERGFVVRARKTGGSAQILGRAADLGGALALSQGALFWSEYSDSSSDGGAIYRTDLATEVTALFQSEAANNMLAVGTDLWFTPPYRCLLVQAPLDGGAPKQHAIPGCADLPQTDGTHIYWGEDYVMRLNLVTGVQEIVADMPTTLGMYVAATRDWLFVTNGGEGLFRIPKPPP